MKNYSKYVISSFIISNVLGGIGAFLMGMPKYQDASKMFFMAAAGFIAICLIFLIVMFIKESQRKTFLKYYTFYTQYTLIGFILISIMAISFVISGSTFQETRSFFMWALQIFILWIILKIGYRYLSKVKSEGVDAGVNKS